MWKELQQWEENNNALCYGVICTQDVREHLSSWVQFEDTSSKRYVCSVDDFTEKHIVDAMQWAYNQLEDPNYEQILESIGYWLIDCYTRNKQQELNLQGGA